MTSNFNNDDNGEQQQEFEEAFERNYVDEQEEDDSLTTYRDLFTQTEDERFQEEENEKLAKTTIYVRSHMTERVYKLDWTLQKELKKYEVGDLVLMKNRDSIYKVIDFGVDVDTYVIRLTNTESNSVFEGTKLKKAPKGSTWEKLIVDPYKRWVKEQEEKKQAKK